MNIALTGAANSAALFLGILDSGEGLSAQQVTDAFGYGNMLIDSWSTDRLMAFNVQVANISLSSGTPAYAVGAPAPAAIESASIITSNGPVMPIRICNALEWEQILNREKISALVKCLFYDRNGYIHLSPVPSGGNLEYTWWSALPLFADTTTPLAMSPGYARMFTLALAMEMAAQFSVKPSESFSHSYQEAMTNVRTLNLSNFGPNPPAGSQAPTGGQ